MNMMNKRAKFHKDSPSDKKVKFNLPSGIELSKTADFEDGGFCVQLYVPLYKRATSSLAHLTNLNFPLSFFMKFSQKMPLYFFCNGAKKSKWPKTQIKGPALLLSFEELVKI